MIKAIIFDMDGVIVNTEPLLLKGSRILFKRYGIDHRKTPAQVFGMKALEAMKLKMKIHGLKGDAKKLLKESGPIVYHLVEKELKTMPGLFKAFDFIKKNNYKIALATSGWNEYVEHVLNKARIKKYFPVIVTSDMVKKTKPNPEIYFKTAKRLGVKPSECVVIEDAPNGLKAAKRAGMKCIIVPHGGTKSLKFPQADAIIKSLKEINSELLNSL